MPYITQSRRDEITFTDTPINSPGELNYMFWKLSKHYIRVKGIRYQTYNDIIGALECCKQEIYRREIADYEEETIQRNGDVT